MALLVKEVAGLKQMVEDTNETVAGLPLEDKGAETGSGVTTTGVNQDREETQGETVGQRGRTHVSGTRGGYDSREEGDMFWDIDHGSPRIHEEPR